MSRPVPLDREVFKAWRMFATRWADNDAYDHVNNTVFYQWFDSAVNAWLIDNRLLDLKAGDPIGLVVETRCNFFAPLSFPKPVEVGIGVAEIGTSSVRYRVGIFDVGAVETAAHGELVHVYVDRPNRRPLPLPPAWRAALETLS